MPIHDGREILMSGRRRHWKQPQPFLSPLLYIFLVFLSFLPSLLDSSSSLFFCDSYPFRILPGWFTGTLGVLLFLLFLGFLSNTVFLVWVLRWFRTTDSCFCNGNLLGKIVYSGGRRPGLFYFSSHLPPSTRQRDKKKMRRLARHFHNDAPHTPSNLTTKTMDCVLFCFFLHLFVLRFGKRFNGNNTLGGRSISAFFRLFRRRWQIGLDPRIPRTRHKTQHHSQIGTKAGVSVWNGTTKTKGGDFHSKILSRDLPPFPTAYSSHSTIFGRSTHSFIPLLICRMLFLIDQDDHGFFFGCEGKGKGEEGC